MSTLCAAISPTLGGVFISADTRVTLDGVDVSAMALHEKWIISADQSMAIGLAGNVVQLQLLAKHSEAIFNKTQSIEKTAHKIKKVIKKMRGDRPQILFVRDGHIYFVDTNGTMINVGPYYAIGSGEQYAMGYLHAKNGLDTEGAVKCAAKYDIYTGGDILSCFLL